MRIPIIVGGIKTTIPNSWDSLTVIEFHRLKQWADDGTNDMVELYSILTGIGKGTIAKLKTWQAKSILERHVEFLKSHWNLKDVGTPSHMEINGRVVAIPNSIDEMKFGEFIAIDKYLRELQEAEGVDADMERMCTVLTICLWGEMNPNEDFELKKVMANKHLVAQANYKDCYAAELFFWTKFYALRRKENGGLKETLTQIRLKLKSNVSKALGIFRLSTRSQGVM